MPSLASALVLSKRALSTKEPSTRYTISLRKKLAYTYGRKTPNHSWAVTVQADKPAAHRGMLFAAKTLALMGTRLATEPTLLAAVRAEFEQAE